MDVDIAPVAGYLRHLQETVCAAFEAIDGGGRFVRERIVGESGGEMRPWVLSDGALIEKAAVHMSFTAGRRMPAAATARRPELAGARYRAASISLIVHPRNPYVPTTHANLRCFLARPSDGPATGWFGGGFDLTPYYGFVADAEHWHRTARAACAPFGDDVYPRLKRRCDEYFYLPHRGETRGVGGLFFDDLDEPDFASCFAFVRAVGDHFLAAYLPIVERRRHRPYGERERSFQLYRRGRYVEFNLLYDRGTLFGLEAGGRVESILASLPPVVRWPYDWRPPKGSLEARLVEDFLRPRQWLGGSGA